MDITALKIRDQSHNLVAYIGDYYDAKVYERINGDYTLSFVLPLDENAEKSQYIVEKNIVETQGNYFVIVHHKRQRTDNGELIVSVECEQVNMYDFNLPEYNTDYFVSDGTPTAILADILDGTGYTVGTVSFVDVMTFSVNEPATRRGLLMQLAVALGGELKFDKYQVSLLTQRGQNRGVQFRVGKNLAGIAKDVDIRSGETKTAFEVSILELNTLEDFAGIEYSELGDTVRMIDPDIGVDEQQRIVTYEYDPRIRINSRVTVANYVNGIEDAIVNIQRSSVAKGRVYNGIRISPDDGFEAIRSDLKARTIANATDGIRLQKGDGTGSTWTDQIYLDVNGDAKFLGKITAAQIDVTGGKITATQIDATNLHVSSANIDGTITADTVKTSWVYTGTINASQVNTSGLAAERIYQPGSPNNYAKIGGSAGDMELYYANAAYFKIRNLGSSLGAWLEWNGSAFLQPNPTNTSALGTWYFGSATVTGLSTAAISGLEARLLSLESAVTSINASISTINSKISYLEDHAFILAYKTGSTLFFNSKNVPGVDNVAL